jgi:hypothetical protein
MLTGTDLLVLLECELAAGDFLWPDSVTINARGRAQVSMMQQHCKSTAGCSLFIVMAFTHLISKRTLSLLQQLPLQSDSCVYSAQVWALCNTLLRAQTV